VKIYTGAGDDGETGLFGGGRVFKDSLRVDAYGDIDELNAALGVARAAGLPAEIEALAARIQGELFVLGADLATPSDTSARSDRVVRLPEPAPRELERIIDDIESELPPLKTFILPGGSPGGAALHLARTICRRAERRVVALGRAQEISPAALPYLNRLSDLLFVMARLANVRDGRPEQTWNPP